MNRVSNGAPLRGREVWGYWLALTLCAACANDENASGRNSQVTPIDTRTHDAGRMQDSGAVATTQIDARAGNGEDASSTHGTAGAQSDASATAAPSSDAASEVAEAGVDAGLPGPALALGSEVYPEDMQSGCSLFLERIETGARESWTIAELLDVDEQHLIDLGYTDQLVPSMVDACTGLGPSLDEQRRLTLYANLALLPWENTPWTRCESAFSLEVPETLPELARVLGYPESEVSSILDHWRVDVPRLRLALWRECSVNYPTLAELNQGMKDAFLFALLNAPAAEVPLYDLPGIALAEDESSGAAWELQVIQPYNHADPDGETFIQRVWLNVLDYDAPTIVLVNTPEQQFNSSPVSDWLRVNVVTVPHRFATQFYGEPQPAYWPEDSALWQFNTAEQAANDVHRVIEALEAVLPSPWLTVGEFRGAGTALVHRRLFPDDVAGTIAFNATLGSDNPERGVDLIASGIREDLDWVTETRDSLIANLPSMAEGEWPIFCARDSDPEQLLGGAGYFEWVVWTKKWACTPRPPYTVDEALSLGAAASSHDMGPDEAQVRHAALAEWGEFETVVPEARAALTDARLAMGLPEEPPKVIPWVTDPTFDPSVLQTTAEWVATEGHDILLVYQEDDPYGAWPVEIGAAENSLRVTLPGTSHCWKEAQEWADAETRRGMRELIESWIGPENVYAEAFDGRLL